MTIVEWKNSLLLRNYAYSSSFSAAMANPVGSAHNHTEADSLDTQLEALGLDADIVRVDLEDLSQAKREAALRSLGVALPRRH